MNRLIGIYKITSPSGRIYIGQSINLAKRKRNYANVQCKSQPKLYNSIKKYGWDAHLFEVLIYCSEDSLNYYETYYIDKYNSFNSSVGLNLMNGGRLGSKMSDESRAKMGRHMKGKIGVLNPWFGRKHSDETKALFSSMRRGVGWSDKKRKVMDALVRKPQVFTSERRMGCSVVSKKNWGNPIFYKKMSVGRLGHLNPYSKSVYQFGIGLIFIKKWDSMIDAARSLNINAGSISRCCNNRQKSVGGFFWAYSGSSPSESVQFKRKKTSNYRRVSQFSMSGDFVRSFDSIKIAADCLSLCPSHIKDCCKKKGRTAGGFFWKYLEDESTLNMSPRYGHKRPIQQFSKENEFIKDWDSALDAALSFGRSDTSCIVRVCSGVKKTAYGFKWKYK
jgi:group I intron endonuclease